MIEPTNACNFSCSMCPNKLMKRKKGFMELELFKLILRKCEESNISRIFLYTVGESFLHPDFFEMLRLSALCPTIKRIDLFTNGSLLNEANIREIVKIKKCMVHFSFSGFDKESYENRYRGGVFEEAVKKIKLFHQIIRESKISPPLSIPLLLIYGVVENDSEKQKTISFLKNCVGLEPYQIYIVCSYDWAGYISNKYHAGACESRNEKKPGQYMCDSIRRFKIGILYDGRVTACGCLDINGELIIGDIRRQSIREIREGAAFKELIQRFKRGNLNGTICYGCQNE